MLSQADLTVILLLVNSFMFIVAAMRNCIFLPKKTIRLLSLVLVVLLLQLTAFTQQSTTVSRHLLFQKNADTAFRSFTNERPYYIIAWDKVKPGNLKVIRDLDERMAIIEVTSLAEFNLLKQQAKIAVATNHWKFSLHAVKTIDKDATEMKTFILTGYHTDSLLSILRNITGKGTIVSVEKLSHSVLLKTTAKFIKDHLLSRKEIIFIDLREKPHPEIGIIGYNRSFHGINAVDYTIPGANGKNIVAGVKEQKMEEADLDLYKRVLASPIAAPAITNHATVIASIIGGSGNSFYDGRGIAHHCTFFPSSFDNLFADDTAILNSNKVTVQNHSYGTVVQQFYGAEAVSYDVLAWSNKNYIPVFSAGNSGLASATDGRYANIPGYANLTGNFKMAKNIISVGAIDNKENIPAESSAGPLYDGRLAPQLIALGPNGTSDAAAVVSGTIAVMQQVYADSNSHALPPASLTKAILYNTADDIYQPGIDYKTGYGQLNSFGSVKAVQQKQYEGANLSDGESWTKTIAVGANTAQLKVTLAWTDSAASVNNNRALIGDLDLEVVELNSGMIYQPWVLNPAAHIDSLAKLPIRRRDSLNTAEQVSISLPAAGNYQIKVKGTEVRNSSLAFHVAWKTDTLNTFYFTSPQHASDVNRMEDESLFIRWKTFVTDTNQNGSLYISYNNGTNWQLLEPSLKLYSNHYQWPIKDTSSTAVLKMETGFGDFLSKHFIISKVTSPVVDFICTDSFSLSWSKHVYASSYKIFSLTDSPYLKQILTVPDTFVVLKRSLYPGLVYAVEPVLNNGIPATRSIAIDLTLQGVACFYKTFYYDLLDQNKLNLVLELSVASYVDSVYFEQVTTTGQWLRTWGGDKVTGTNRLYNQLINDIDPGITYWRARIKLKTNAVVYTEIISVLTTGKRNIVFYPNPAARNNPLNYILQQGVSTSSRLQLFDMSGRLVRSFSEMPGNIDVSSLAPGMLIYKLMNSDGQLLETGKLVIQ